MSEGKLQLELERPVRFNEVKQEIVLRVIELNKGCLKSSSKELDLAEKTLYNWLECWGKSQWRIDLVKSLKEDKDNPKDKEQFGFTKRHVEEIVSFGFSDHGKVDCFYLCEKFALVRRPEFRKTVKGVETWNPSVVELYFVEDLKKADVTKLYTGPATTVWTCSKKMKFTLHRKRSLIQKCIEEFAESSDDIEQ